MSTLVLTIAYFDDAHVHECEFNSLDAIKVYLDAGDVDSISMIKLNDTNTGITCEGIDAIYQYIRENTGPVLLTHDLSQCGDACNCMKCNPSKSSCIALRASELNIEVIDHPAVLQLEPGDLNGIPMRVGDSIEFQPLPGAVKFSELEDGAWFCPLSLWAYGSKRAFQKTLEDGGEHNAVYTSFTETGFKFKDDDLVMRLNK